MNREDLLFAIEEEASYQKLINVLRAVVQLHKPWKTLPQLENPLVCCETCEENYPCPTIQAIEKEIL